MSQPHLVGHEPVAGEPGPVQGVLALFDPLLRSTSAIVEMDYPLGASRHVGDDEATRGNSSPRCHSTLATTRR